MGVTSIDIQKLEGILKNNPEIKRVLELGAQNNYGQPNLPAPYMKEWYEAMGIEYECIDISAENGCRVIDLSEPLENPKWFDELKFFPLVTDFGTSEHVGRNGKHDIEAFYNCWKTKYDLLQAGGIMVNENPKTGNWPGHGFQWYNHEFYRKLEEFGRIKVVELEDIAAMGNITDGWNVYCSFVKTALHFVSFEEFKQLPVCLV